jgi:hypothetical protein
MLTLKMERSHQARIAVGKAKNWVILWNFWKETYF